jgi:hypothetical protein
MGDCFVFEIDEDDNVTQFWGTGNAPPEGPDYELVDFKFPDNMFCGGYMWGRRWRMKGGYMLFVSRSQVWRRAPGTHRPDYVDRKSS